MIRCSTFSVIIREWRNRTEEYQRNTDEHENNEKLNKDGGRKRKEDETKNHEAIILDMKRGPEAMSLYAEIEKSSDQPL